MTTERPSAVVLVSGGLDSTTVLGLAREQGFRIYALSFDYGQRHRWELEAAKRVCDTMKVEQHITLQLDLRAFGGSALTSDNIEIPQDRDESEMQSGVPVTYVPARNTVFLSLALGWAEVLGAADIFIGVNAVDYSGYPDCRPEFIEHFQRLAQHATKVGAEGSCQWTIHTPLISLTKAEIIREGLRLGVDYSLTRSCYDPDTQGNPCGRCDSCHLRWKGFEEAGFKDPLPYPGE